ncbi:HD domain-containing protein [Shewanella sp. 10N.286.52.B9]|uniref:HD domain-containing protein n=1 Tax=unclassified Shewanella TaxID=196818 RepID=UPI001F52EABE|nr:HD domain-containing protein [Shewanella sp. 10N.286.52.B9]
MLTEYYGIHLQGCLNEIKGIVEFIVEIEKLKSVTPNTKPVGLERYENSAEHSWHVCISALMLKEFANEPVDINRVIKMLLLHDFGEIDAGDTIVYASSNTHSIAEQQGVERLFKTLPEYLADEYLQLWLEFEAGKTADAIFAKAIDRVPPLLHNIHGGGHSWKKHNISKQQVMSLNGDRIAKGSHSLWTELEKQLISAAEQGLLK